MIFIINIHDISCYSSLSDGQNGLLLNSSHRSMRIFLAKAVPEQRSSSSLCSINGCNFHWSNSTYLSIFYYLFFFYLLLKVAINSDFWTKFTRSVAKLNNSGLNSSMNLDIKIEPEMIQLHTELDIESKKPTYIVAAVSKPWRISGVVWKPISGRSGCIRCVWVSN